MLSIIMFSVVRRSVIMPNVVMLSVIMLCVTFSIVILCVVMLSATGWFETHDLGIISQISYHSDIRANAIILFSSVIFEYSYQPRAFVPRKLFLMFASKARAHLCGASFRHSTLR
jgi:hypothetical protein